MDGLRFTLRRTCPCCCRLACSTSIRFLSALVLFCKHWSGAEPLFLPTCTMPLTADFRVTLWKLCGTWSGQASSQATRFILCVPSCDRRNSDKGVPRLRIVLPDRLIFCVVCEH